jgi:DNA-binding XRE family transcriptional regulator
MTVNQAVRALRQELAATQQSFAVSLGLSISTIVKYEADRMPRISELSRFLDLALSSHRQDIAEVFAGAMAKELDVNTAHVARTREERLLVDLLLLTMRNRTTSAAGKRNKQFGRIDEGFSQIRDHLVENFRLLASLYHKGEGARDADTRSTYTVLDILDVKAIETLEKEVAEMKESAQ